MRGCNWSANRQTRRDSMPLRWMPFQGTPFPCTFSPPNAAIFTGDGFYPEALLLLHISNLSLNLEPVARGLARHLGWKAALFASGPNEETGESTSRWVLITENSSFLQQPDVAARTSGWTDGGRPPITWTDDFASLWHVLRF